MPEWPLPHRRIKEIARHYAEELPWFGDEDWEQDREARVNIGGAFRDFLGIAEELAELDLSRSPQSVVGWIKATGLREAGHWSAAFGMAESCLHSQVWNLIQLTDDATSEEPLYGESAVAAHERCFWADGTIPARPAVDALFGDGIITQDWISFLLALRESFEALADEMCRMHTQVTAARSLLFRGFFLCLDLIYAERALGYAWHLYASEDDVPDFSFSKMIDIFEEAHLLVSMVGGWLDRDDLQDHRERDRWLRELGVRPGEAVEVRQNEDGDWAVFVGHQQVYVPDDEVAEARRMTRHAVAEEFADELRAAARRYSEDDEDDADHSDGDGE